MLLNLLRVVGDPSPRTCLQVCLGSLGLYLLIAPDVSEGDFFLMYLRTDAESMMLESLMV